MTEVQFLLDTDISSYIIKSRPEKVRETFRRIHPRYIGISVITYAELLFWVERSTSRKLNRSIIDDFTAPLTIIPWTGQAAASFAKIRNQLENAGMPLAIMDTLIAAHAFSLNATLVTNNTRHFDRIEGLQVENWI